MITYGYKIAALSNILGILLFSKCFSNSELTELFPEVFSKFGLVAILLWGLAYLAVSESWAQQRKLALVFALEKTVYVISWIYWLYHHFQEIPQILEQTPLTGLFYLVYGPNDFIFLIVFMMAFLHGKVNGHKLALNTADEDKDQRRKVR